MKQKPLRAAVLGRTNRTCNWQIAGGWVWTTLRKKKTKTPGAPTYRWVPIVPAFYLQDLDQVLTVTIEEKSLCALRRRENKPLRNTPEHSVLNQGQPLDKLATGVWKYWGKGNTELQPTLAILPHLRERKKTEKHLWSSRSRGTGSLHDWDLIIGL